MLNKKTYKNIKNSTFIISQTLIMKLHNTFDVCRLQLVTNKNRRSKLEFIKPVIMQEIFCKQQTYNYFLTKKKKIITYNKHIGEKKNSNT